MANMNELANLVKELEEQLVTCIRCGMCQSVCPLFEQTRKEADVARGKLALLTGLMDNIFSDPDGVNERLNRCLLCGSCAANCPSGVNVLEIFIKARAILAEYKGLSPAKQLIFKKMLANPGTFDTLVAWAGKFQGLFAKPDDNAQGTSCARLVSPLLADRHFLPLAKTPFHKEIPKDGFRKKGKKLKAAIFTGCLIDKVFPNVARSAIKVLDHHGVGMSIPAGQGCCGIPALASGDRETFTRLVDHNLALFRQERFDVLVTACATCTSTIKKLWPSVYKDASSGVKEQITELAGKTMDINQFIVDNVAPELSEAGATPDQAAEVVTYHDPCHLKKSLGVSAQPRALVRAAGCNLKEMSGSDKCCGMGGSFNVYHYDLSASIGQIKQENIAATSATTLATGCPACMMQISDMLAKGKANIRVRHPLELYAEHLENTNR
ncbi:MAG TPA: (Fe-S)-binding protein [Desulfobacteraceae bacterium]|nr:(Fe-S)-binding protein [Desulfobacteraceae bacterium]